MSLASEVSTATDRELRCYLDGASRDGTFSARHGTLRISQKGPEWLEILKLGLSRLGARSWSYREGQRDVWTLETCWWDPCAPETPKEMASFARGYFDAEGGVPRDEAARFYVQFVQKDHADLSAVRQCLESIGISCGRIHNPSVRVDPHYWRFFVRARSQLDFCSLVSSWHPRKRSLIIARRRGLLTPSGRP